MKKNLVPFVFGVGVLILFGCAAVKDVQQATDLIRKDNELTRLLVEVRPKDQDGSATYLVGIATHAKKIRWGISTFTMTGIPQMKSKR